MSNFDYAYHRNMLDATCVHEWRHSSNGNSPGSSIVVTHSREFCDDVVEEFAHYLAAVGFYEVSIIEAFESYVETNKQAIINAAKRLSSPEQPVVEKSE